MSNGGNGGPDQPLSEKTASATITAETSLPTRVCPRCSVQSQAAGEFCPNCGTSFLRQASSGRPGKTVLAVILAVLVLGGVGAGVALKVQHDNDAKAQKAAISAQEWAASSARAEKDIAENSERTRRAQLVSGLESSILKDAKADAAKGVLDGPITVASCTPLGGGSTDDLTALTGSFECIAVNKTNADGTRSGYRFSGTVNYKDASVSWHLGS